MWLRGFLVETLAGLALLLLIGFVAVAFGPLAALVGYLAVYTVAGAVLAFNLWGASDRLARHYSAYPRMLRYFGRDKPGAWRAGGLLMLPFGLLLIVWLLTFTFRVPVPPLDRRVAAAILGVAGLLTIGAYVVSVRLRGSRGAGR
jgi:hypothetical protein